MLSESVSVCRRATICSRPIFLSWLRLSDIVINQQLKFIRRIVEQMIQIQDRSLVVLDLENSHVPTNHFERGVSTVGQVPDFEQVFPLFEPDVPKCLVGLMINVPRGYLELLHFVSVNFEVGNQKTFSGRIQLDIVLDSHKLRERKVDVETKIREFAHGASLIKSQRIVHIHEVDHSPKSAIRSSEVNNVVGDHGSPRQDQTHQETDAQLLHLEQIMENRFVFFEFKSS